MADPRIKHIVVLMMENRSFDHLVGLLKRESSEIRGVLGVIEKTSPPTARASRGTMAPRTKGGFRSIPVTTSTTCTPRCSAAAPARWTFRDSRVTTSSGRARAKGRK